ncbi:MAG: hypothetical protein GF355_05375, partial [Candidatus Eisenbacteria bacterium]|nr:hypothetical protein [Candidatus Eisenbacteria bacterium]
MKRLAVSIVVVGILGGWIAPAAADVQSLQLSDAMNQVTLVAQEEDRLSYRVEVGELAAMEVAAPGGSFTRLFIPGFHHSQREGAPELPMMNRLIEIPFGASVEVEVVAVE